MIQSNQQCNELAMQRISYCISDLANAVHTTYQVVERTET